MSTKSWSNLRKRISRKLKVGSSRVKFTQDGAKKMLKQSMRFNVKDQLKSYVKIQPKKKRNYKVHHTKKSKVANPGPKDKFKDVQSLNYLIRRKIKTPKDLWMRKIREMRSYLKSKRTELGINYSKFRRRAKGNYYKNLEDLKKKT